MPRTKLTKPEIVRAAVRAFRRRGYAATSMAQLAEATGLTKGAFYHHFPDKAAVMEAALASTVAFAEERWFGPARDGRRGVTDRVDLMVDGARALFREPDEGCFVANTALAGGPDAERFRPHLVAFADAWRAALASLARDAGLPDPRDFALRTVADVEGGIVLMRIYGDGAHLEAALGRFRDNFPPAA